ncbi:MAG: RNA methyltransferase [Alphaproteobacteria bacterium]|nr:MAG: RNA methyltransferase [Alphaproteobacteria bacterium]
MILVRPQLGENIGKAARAMRNFGLKELRLVAPRDGWPNPAAGPAAAGADDVLAGARVFETVADAIADLELVFATTARRRDLPKPCFDPEDTIAQIRKAAHARAGILFGPERSGLDNDDIALADALVSIPADPTFSSLNLAQAVLVLAYEWGRQVLRPRQRLPQPIRPAAPRAYYQRLFDLIEPALDARGYFPSPQRKPVQIRSLRSLFLQARWSEQEVQTLFGVIKALLRSPGGGRQT